LKNNIINIVSNNFNAKEKHCLVIGDIMLDQYIFGDVERISPEASVPVLNKSKHINRIGGAGNVALNLQGLGIKTILIGEVGNDISGKTLIKLLKENFISTKYLIKKRGGTTTKTRIMSKQQQIVRIDEEQPSLGLNNIEVNKILRLLKGGPSIIIISDYEKGLLTPNLLKKIIQLAVKNKIPVFVDPKGEDLEKYRGATAITPNKKEAFLLTNNNNNNNNKDEKLLENKLKKIIKSYGFHFIAMTQGELGMKYITNTKVTNFPASTSQQVFDVSGAGDTVISTLAASVIGKIPIEDGFKLANLAAGIVISKLGTMPIKKNDLLHELENQNYSQKNKIFLKKELSIKVESLKEQNKIIGFTNGCFDILHAGHVTYLERAKDQVDFLILALNTNVSVKKIKGPKRPLVNEEDRARILCALESVDAVILFNEVTPLKLINDIKPDVLIKGNDYDIKNVVGSKEIKAWGGKVVLIPIVQGKSTTKIIDKLS